MDIGGGSVEFIICNAQKALWQHSFEIGAQRLLDKFHHHDPILPAALESLAHYLEEKLSLLFSAIALYRPDQFIGASGTFESLLAIYHQQAGLAVDVHATAQDLPREQFACIYAALCQKSRQERLQIPGLTSKRVDMIVVACALIHCVLTKTTMTTITYATYSLITGVFFDALEKLQP